MNIYKTYKFYTERKQRIAAYAFTPIGEQGGNPHIHVLLVFCSHKDHFEKKLADWVFEQFLKGEKEVVEDEITGVIYHPKLKLIPIIEGKSKKSFLYWMKSNYYRKVVTYLRMEQACLAKDSNLIPIDRPRAINQKMSSRL